MKQVLMLFAVFAFAAVLLASSADARLSYQGIETTINDDLSASVNVTLKFADPAGTLEYRTSMPVAGLKTGGTFGPAICKFSAEGSGSVIRCSLSGMTAEKNTLYLNFDVKNAVNYSYGRYHFSEGFSSSIESDKLFSMVKLTESATLAEYPPENSYAPSNGTTITDGKRIMVIWESGGVQAGKESGFSAEYNMPPIRGSVTRYILIGAGIVIVVVVVAAFIYTRRASKVNKGRVIASVLNADEKRIVDIISASGTGALQKHVVKESGFSKAKVSRLVK